MAPLLEQAAAEKAAAAAAEAAAERQVTVAIRGLAFTYPGIDGQPPPGAKPLIQDLSLTLRAGDRCLLVGANGAGELSVPQYQRPLLSNPADLQCFEWLSRARSFHCLSLSLPSWDLVYDGSVANSITVSHLGRRASCLPAWVTSDLQLRRISASLLCRLTDIRRVDLPFRVVLETAKGASN